MTRAQAGLFDLYLDAGVFDPATCEALVAEMAAAPNAPATVYGKDSGGAVDERVRKVARVATSPSTVGLVTQRLLDARNAIGKHFGVELHDCEPPQFLRYAEGGFFVAHQDGNTGMLRTQAEVSRKVSVVIFLNSQSEEGGAGTFGGGSLLFTEWRAGRTNGQFALAAQAGLLVAFTPETTHEVTPVTRGERYSIASWYR